MIRIFTESDDLSASKVIEWINFFKYDYLRINNEPNNLQVGVYLNNDIVEISIEPYNNIENSKTWYRRGYIYNTDKYDIPDNVDMKYFNRVKEHLKSEFQAFIKFFYSIESSIDNPNKYEVNKLDTLLKARNIGLQIPQTLVTKNKKDILKYLGNKDPIICKPITDLLQINKNGLNRSHLIKLLNTSAINDLPEVFGISLFQELIIKKYEIRVFCIYNEVFAVANFSNLNTFSKIDGRNVLNSENNVNRIVPYLLSTEIKNRIILLLKDLQIESGSLDFIYGVDKNLYFLEVNPVGQFGGVSYFGNFHIEKSIAKMLCANENN